MKQKTLIILLFSYLSSYSQITHSITAPEQMNTKLDGRNGFKDFKFGDSISKYSNRLNQIGCDQFELIAKEPSSVFGLKWEKFYILSDKQKLKSIAVYWKDNKSTYDNLSEKLEIIFGKSYSPKDKRIKKQGFDMNVWQGNNVKIILYRDNKDASPQQRCFTPAM